MAKYSSENSNAQRRLQLAAEDFVSLPHVVQLLAITARCLMYDDKPVSRRNMIDLIADIFRDNDPVLVSPDGTLYELPDLDSLFEPEGFSDELTAEHHFEWCGNFLNYAIDPPTRRLPAQYIERLQIIDAAWRLGGDKVWRR